MKKNFLVAGLAVMLMSAGAIAADAGAASKNTQNDNTRLEEAVSRLENVAERFEDKISDVTGKEQNWFCTAKGKQSVSGLFGDYFYGIGSTKAEAMFRALTACKKGPGNYTCSLSDVNCSKDNK